MQQYATRAGKSIWWDYEDYNHGIKTKLLHKKKPAQKYFKILTMAVFGV